MPNQAPNDGLKKENEPDVEETNITFNPPLYIQRYSYAYDILFKHNPRIETLADFGCAEGGFVQRVKRLPFLTKLYAVDISTDLVEFCKEKAAPVAWDMIFGRHVSLEISLVQADVTIPDPIFQNLDAITCIEIIEHLPSEQLERFPETIFGYFRPKVVIISTPNREFNVLFALEEGRFRHWDHKFEWTREEFRSWCEKVGKKYGYSFEISGVGLSQDESLHLGFCSQIAIFSRKSEETSSVPLQLESKSLAKILDTYVYPKRTSSPPKVVPCDWSTYKVDEEESNKDDVCL